MISAACSSFVFCRRKWVC